MAPGRLWGLVWRVLVRVCGVYMIVREFPLGRRRGQMWGGGRW